ncbi:MAG TPA: hypothetical protein VFO73_04250 [Candidatus Limnocylindrales bacterium]|nr:hypothetical protein [Candidatus Limnocylindrales bacterium]
MTANLELERRVADYYASEAPRRAPDWVLRTALATIDLTPQRRGLFGLRWRGRTPSGSGPFVIAAVAVAAIVVGLSVARSQETGGGGTGSPPPASPGGSVGSVDLPTDLSALPPLGTTFTSSTYGITISYPTGWNVVRASATWTTGIPRQSSGEADVIYQRETDSPFIAVASMPLGSRTADAWMVEFGTSPGWDDTCPWSEPTTIDGRPGLIFGVGDCDGALRAMTTAGDRGYMIWLYRIDDLDVFKDILATVVLQPDESRGDVAITR